MSAYSKSHTRSCRRHRCLRACYALDAKNIEHPSETFARGCIQSAARHRAFRAGALVRFFTIRKRGCFALFDGLGRLFTRCRKRSTLRFWVGDLSAAFLSVANEHTSLGFIAFVRRPVFCIGRRLVCILNYDIGACSRNYRIFVQHAHIHCRPSVPLSGRSVRSRIDAESLGVVRIRDVHTFRSRYAHMLEQIYGLPKAKAYHLLSRYRPVWA